MANLLFYLMATLATVCAIGVVVARSPVVSVVSLLGSFASLAIIYLLAGYQFLAAVQILVYGGAVMVLFLFTIMLLNLGDPAVIHGESEPLFHHSRRTLLGLGVAAAVGAAGLIAILRVAWSAMPQPAELPEGGLDPLDQLAASMFTHYSLAFEAASVLLLATAVGVLVLAKRNRRPTAEVFPRESQQPATPSSPPTSTPSAGAQGQEVAEEGVLS